MRCSARLCEAMRSYARLCEAMRCYAVLTPPTGPAAARSGPSGRRGKGPARAPTVAPGREGGMRAPSGPAVAPRRPQ
eukprot:4009951-Pyramimonas_sp.AAC.1